MPSALNTKTAILNMALLAIKQRTITSPDEASQQARVGNVFYDVARRAALRACDWPWATVSADLTKLGDWATADAYPDDSTKQDVFPGWSYLYTYPTTCLRVHRVFNSVCPGYPVPVSVDYPYDDYESFYADAFAKQNDFKIVRSPITQVTAIASQLMDAQIEYTKDITDESIFDDYFVHAFSLFLADFLAYPLTADKQVKAMTAAELVRWMGEAKRKALTEHTERGPQKSNYEKAR